MQIATDRPQAPTAIRTDLGAIFVSLELSRSTWLITSLSPGGGEKMSKHTVRSGDVAGLRTRFSQLKDKVQVRMGQIVSNHRDSGGGSGRLLDPPIAAG
jgi:transposase